MDTVCTGFMPRHEYDSQGSTVAKFANDYIQIKHVMTSTESAGVLDKVYTRLHVIDALLDDGWEPLGSAAHQVGTGATALVETWIKRERHLKK